MSWSEIKKALNTDLNTPLNTLITNAKDSLASAIATVQSTVNTINTNAANANSNANTAKTNAANANTNAANAYNIVNNATYGNNALYNNIRVPAGMTIKSSTNQYASLSISGRGAIISVVPAAFSGSFQLSIDGTTLVIFKGFSTSSGGSYSVPIYMVSFPLYFNTSVTSSSYSTSYYSIIYYVLY